MGSLDTRWLLELFERDRAALTLYARNWVDESAAADAVQQTFIHLSRLREPPREPRAWLFRATRNAAISLARAGARRRKREQRASLTRDAFEQRPDALVDREAVAAVLCTLTDDEREIVVLRVWAELTLADIALVTSSSVTTVHRTYQRALASIRTALEASWHTNRK